MIQSLFTMRRTVVAFVALVVIFGCLAVIAAPASAHRSADVAGASVHLSGDGVGSHYEQVHHNADGSVTTNTFYKGGAKETKTVRPDGSSTTTTTSADGKTRVTVTNDGRGNVTVVSTP